MGFGCAITLVALGIKRDDKNAAPPRDLRDGCPSHPVLQKLHMPHARPAYTLHRSPTTPRQAIHNVSRPFLSSPVTPKFAASPNRSTYEDEEIVGRYARSEEIYPAESWIFHHYSRQFGGSVLDIAIGAGRTTRALLQDCKRYVGLDYSATMVGAAREHFPAADLRVMDMREVPRAFASERFDAILISYNSIDYIPWEDRCALIRALPALLAPGGVFAFSCHDLATADIQRGFRLRPDLRSNLSTVYRPRSLARLLLRTPPWLLKAWRNSRRNRSLERSFDGYAYVNDIAEDYGLLTLYVSHGKQTELLKASGFSKVDILQPWMRAEQAYFNYYVSQR